MLACLVWIVFVFDLKCFNISIYFKNNFLVIYIQVLEYLRLYHCVLRLIMRFEVILLCVLSELAFPIYCFSYWFFDFHFRHFDYNML